MDKRGFLKFIIAGIVIFLLIAGGFLYFSFYKNGLKINSGDLSINIAYNDSSSQNTSKTEDNKINITANTTIPNSSIQQQNSSNSTFQVVEIE